MINPIDTFIDTKLLRTELAEMRKTRHMTQAQVSELTGLSRSTISNIESGEEKGVTLSSIMKYARAVNCSIFVKAKGDNNE